MLFAFSKQPLNSRRTVYVLLSMFMFAYFFAQAMSISLLSIWFKGPLHLTGEQAGIVFSANFIAAMISQPIYGYVSDRIGMRKYVLWFLALMVAGCGPFFTQVYAPLLRSHLLLGAICGGAYLGLTFIAGSFALESYTDRLGRHHGFEFSRVRLWGSIGFACAAFFSGTLFNINPMINFALASAAGFALLPLIFLLKPAPESQAQGTSQTFRVTDSLALLKMPKFWGYMVLILGVTNLYLVFDQQFPAYYASQFLDPAVGRTMFGRLNSAQIFVEAGGLFIAPWIVQRIGIKRSLLLASGIMIFRITGSGLVSGPVAISAMKMLHSVELPILVVANFKYIANHFASRLASTVYMVGVSFGHSLGISILSPLVGRAYDHIGFAHTYLCIGALAFIFWIWSWFSLSTDLHPRPDAPLNPQSEAS
jgi:OHS family lactose permease-like MFS transporter